MFFIRNLKWVVVLMVILIMSTAAYALADANTVPASKAGDGSGAITGYDITTVHYNLNTTTTPVTISSVTFTLDIAPVAGGTITIKLVSAGTTWYTCSNVTTAVSCTTTGAQVSTANSLEVVIAQ
jgi:hypothetical protein